MSNMIEIKALLGKHQMERKAPIPIYENLKLLEL